MEGEYKKIKISKLKIFQVATFVLAVLLVTSLYFGFYSNPTVSGNKDEIAETSIQYLKENFGVEATLMSADEVSGMYNLTLLYDGQVGSLFVSKDGRFLLLGPVDTEAELPVVDPQTNEVQEVSCETLEKAEAPEFYAFVVSYCPYGLQMQRIIYNLPEDVRSSFEIKYIGEVVDGKVTSMHGEQEAQENLRQICIREEQESKYWNYLGCFMQEGDAEGCLTTAKIDEAKLEICMEGDGVDYAEEDFILANSYFVSGSPTLIFNGNNVDEQGAAQGFNLAMRSPELIKEVACCSMESPVDGCSDEISVQSAPAAFSTAEVGSAAASAATCN